MGEKWLRKTKTKTKTIENEQKLKNRKKKILKKKKHPKGTNFKVLMHTHSWIIIDIVMDTPHKAKSQGYTRDPVPARSSHSVTLQK